ncbi:MAG TPA: Fic family protein [Solirubrobacteraceae bacterium]|nr:Fic family protein [Solirubrobacteraceae bacterium]
MAQSKVDSAAILPAQEAEMRKIAQAESVHYSNKLEGNDLPLIEAQRAVGGELTPDDRAKIELVNYVRALRLIEDLHAKDALVYEPAVLLSIHGTLTHGLGGTKPGFEPRHEGAWRDGVVVVMDKISGEVFHEGEPADDVPAYMEWLCEWLNTNRSRRETYPVPVLAGVAHWAVTWIHPFADGNGRMARLLTGMVLLREGLLERRVFSFERHYAGNKDAYLLALRTVRKHDKDLGPWLEYFLDGLAKEYERVAERVQTLTRVSAHVRTGTELNLRQEQALTDLVVAQRTRFTRAEYQQIAGVGLSTAKEDVADLVQAGVLHVNRQGPSTDYVFARYADGHDRATKWTDERIENEMREFLEGRDRWPTVAEWRASGKKSLYDRASTAGGIERWRHRLGY